MNKLYFAVTVLVLLLLIWLVPKFFTASKYWESTLRGPYQGQIYKRPIQSAPSSILSLADNVQLNLYNLSDRDCPVIELKKDNDILWRRLMLPSYIDSDGKIKTTFLRDAKLIKLTESELGKAVYFSCYWGWGGEEAGLIDFTDEFEFISFRISW
ncbi:MAG: hypothetical protein AAGA80_28010 [Cyanobacteria bacterium P01_F01_bin.143]